MLIHLLVSYFAHIITFDLQATPLTDETKKKILSDYEKYDTALEEKKKRHREKNPDRYSQDVEDEQNLFYKSLIGMYLLCFIGMCIKFVSCWQYTEKY